MKSNSLAIRHLLFVLPLLLFCGSAAAERDQYTEGFTSKEYCDVLHTTAWWDTLAGELKLPSFELVAVGSYETPHYAEDVVLAGDHAYIADGTSGLQVINITDPTDPQGVGSCDTPGWAYDLAVAGDFAFVVDKQSGLYVMDISDPSNPVSVGSYEALIWPQRMAIAGNYAYVADYSAGMQVLDISDPANPIWVASCATLDLAFDVAVAGDHAYVADNHSGLLVFDVSDPTAPTMIGFLDTPDAAMGIAVAGDLAFVADHQSGLQIINISDPTNPTSIASFNTPGDADQVTITGNYAYIADSSRGIRVVDISNPAAPTLAGSYQTPANAQGVAIAGRYAYVADHFSGLQVLETAEAVVPPLFCGRGGGSAHHVATAGDHAFAAASSFGFRVIDISDPAAPALVVTYDTPDIAEGVAVSGDLAFVACRLSGLLVLDISVPASPALVGICNTPGYAERVCVEGDHAYVADLTTGLTVIDISDPAAPTIVGSVDTPDEARDVTVAGDYAYLADRDTGLLVIDVSDPSTPVIVGSRNTPDLALGLAVSGDHAYIADYMSGLQVIDIGDPTSPTLVGSYDTPGRSWNVAVEGNYAYVADQTTLQVIDIVDPTAPAQVGSYPSTSQSLHVVTEGDHAFVGDGGSGLLVLEIFQRRFDTQSNIGQSLPVDASDVRIARARMTSTQVESVSWELSANGGTDWESVTPDGSWHDLTHPGTDLLWRSTHSYIAAGVNPTCNSLWIEWETTPPCTLAFAPAEIATYYPCGGSYSLDLWGHGVTDLGAFETCTGFDDILVQFEGVVADTSFLGSTGRDVYPVGPVNCDPSCHNSGMRYGAYTLGDESGPSGTGRLAEVSFSRLFDIAIEDSLCLEECELVDTQLPPTEIEVAEATGVRIAHRSFTYGDFDDDGEVTMVDIMQVANRWGCHRGEPCYEDTFDVNLLELDNYCASFPNDTINVVDIQSVAGRWEGGARGASSETQHFAGPLQTGPVVRIWPDTLELSGVPGDTASITVQIEDAVDLGAFEFALSFDPSVVHVEDAELGAFPSSTGRAVFPLGPDIDNASGSLSLAVWTAGENPGPDGDGTLARVVLSIESCGTETELDLTEVLITDPNGWPRPLGGIVDGWAQTACPDHAPEEASGLPRTFALYPARPNPPAPWTTITFAVPEAAGATAPVEVVIVDLPGRLVRSLAAGRFSPGRYDIVWDATDEAGHPVASGVYFCRLQAEDVTRSRRITVLR